jgi:hypothetical protein
MYNPTPHTVNMQYGVVIGIIAPNLHLFHCISLFLVGTLFLIDTFLIYVPLLRNATTA